MGLRGPKPKRTEVTWSPKLAYAVGLLASDGCLSSDGRHIDLTSKDKEQLLNFMFCIDRKIRITKKSTGGTYALATRVQFSDVTLYQFLLGVGLTPKKSLTIGALLIPDKYFFEFLRGSFDGDGSFYSYFDKRWRSSFMYYLNFTSASSAHILWLQTTLGRLLQVQGHISKSKQLRPGATVRVETLRYAKKEALKIMRRMYKDPLAPCLKRKRLKIHKALRIVGESLVR